LITAVVEACTAATTSWVSRGSARRTCPASHRSTPGTPLSLPAREAALGAAADIGAGVSTLHESLWRHAHLDPGRIHVFLRDDPALRAPGGAGAAPGSASESEEPITYGRLRDEAAAVAGGLRERDRLAPTSADARVRRARDRSALPGRRRIRSNSAGRIARIAMAAML